MLTIAGWGWGWVGVGVGAWLEFTLFCDSSTAFFAEPLPNRIHNTYKPVEQPLLKVPQLSSLSPLRTDNKRRTHQWNRHQQHIQTSGTAIAESSTAFFAEPLANRKTKDIHISGTVINNRVLGFNKAYLSTPRQYQFLAWLEFISSKVEQSVWVWVWVWVWEWEWVWV